ncbi:DUF1819 family protein [Methylolobus aquaticus]
MTPSKLYTSRLGAGLGLINETLALLDLWEPGLSSADLNERARDSGQFPNVTARRLRNIIMECFAPRYLVDGGQPAKDLKALAPCLPRRDLQQVLLLYTARANAILADFIRQVYWERYAGGHQAISNDDAAAFIRKALDLGHMQKSWSDSMIQNGAGYLTGCCADYGLLESGRRNKRTIQPVYITPSMTVYLAYNLHFKKLGDNTLLQHEDWALFGLGAQDVLDELKRQQLKGHFLVQSAGDLVRLTWKYPDMETLCHVLAQG